MNNCRLCDDKKIELLIDFGYQPVVHHLLNRNDDEHDVYPFQLGTCTKCSLTQLLQPISPQLLYENYFTISAWKLQPHVDRLIDVMKSITGMDENSILLEVGCNDGSFIQSLRNAGIHNCTGIEPSKDAYSLANSKGIKVHNEFFSVNNPNLPMEENYYDIVICRHVLEHICDLEEFMITVGRCLKDNGVFVLEIPDSSWNFEYMDYALWEEHVNYFTLDSITNLLKKYDFGIIHHETTLFSGRSLTVFAEKRNINNGFEHNSSNISKWLSYGKNWGIFKKQMGNFISSKQKVVIYGCGSRSSTFVNFFELENIACFIDDQKEKQNYFVPGNKLEILPWDDSWSNAFFLLGVNAESEIKVIRNRDMNTRQFASILPPSRYLPEFWKKIIHA